MGIASLKQRLIDISRHGIAYARELAGAQQKYCIRGAYTHRNKYCYFDDTEYKDEYQKEVYERAAEIAEHAGLSTIYDVGCGSGYKLIKYLGQYETVGFDVPETLEFLRRTYPERNWTHATFSDRSHPPADLVICSDVIEHVMDPDELMNFLLSLTSKWLVISTPDRAREYSVFSRFQLGPPHTDHHIREWSFNEFHRYIEQFVDIQEHCHPHPTHATQMIVATLRS